MSCKCEKQYKVDLLVSWLWDYASIEEPERAMMLAIKHMKEAE